MSKEDKPTLSSNSPIEILGAQGGMQLRQLMLADATELFALIEANQEHLSQYEDTTAKKYPTLESVLNSIENPENPNKLRFGIRNDSGELVGSINLTPGEDDPTQAEIGYYIDHRYGGRGYASQAATLLCKWAFGERGFVRIFACTHPDNIFSQKVLLKAGFERMAEPAENGDVVFEKLRSHD